MAISVASTSAAPTAIGPYSQATIAGDLVFCSGQIPIDPKTGALLEADVAAQVDLVLRNLTAVLEAAGSDLGHVLKTTVYLTDLSDFAAMNSVYERHFGKHRPARVTVQVAALPAKARVEVDCFAVRHRAASRELTSHHESSAAAG